MLGAASLAFASCQSLPIVVTPAQQLFGQVVDPTGAPVASSEADLYSVGFDAHQKKTVLDSEYSIGQSAADGTFELDFPRHATYNSSYVVVIPSGLGYPMYGFATQQQITVDLTSTVLYELIVTSPSDLTAFSVTQVDTLLAMARASIARNIAASLIQTTAPFDKLHKAYKNALAADSAFMSTYQLYALQTGTNVLGLLPFGTLNTIPSILSTLPKINSPNVNEAQTLPMNVSAVDYDGDFIFYSWTIQKVANNCNQPGEVLAGSLQTVQLASFAWNFTPDYSFSTWNNPNTVYKVIATASDGGLYSTKIWCTNVANVERPPSFSTTPPKTGKEDVLWTYTPAASSPDGAPFTLSLNSGAFPAGMDMCIDVAPPTSPPVWQWQVAATSCTTPNLITWTPTNCQSIGPQFVQIKATDAVGATMYQTFNVNVTEVNDNPVITSLPPGAPAPTGTEAIPWSYQLMVTDPQADPAAQPASISGSDPSPYTYKPGGVGCPDQLTFTLTQSPPSAKIDSNTGLITWTPPDAETGIQKFTVIVTDGHGGSATQSWQVVVLNTEEPPAFIAPSGGTTIQVYEELYQTQPYSLDITAKDPDAIDNNDLNLTIAATGMPPTMTLNKHGGAPGLGTDYTYLWPINDTMTPSTWNVTATVCDTNSVDAPLGAFLAPVYPVLGPPHNHFCNVESFTINAPKRNIQPQFTSQPPSVVIGNSTFSYTAQVYDGNVAPPDTLTFSLVQAPGAMTLTPVSTTAPTGSATLSWTPNNSTDLGYHTIKIQVADGNAYPGDPHTATQAFSLFVQELNLPPTITSTPVTTAQDGTQYTYQCTASDPNITSPNNKITWSLVTEPSGMLIDPKTGLITWTPTVAQAKAATASVTVKATDGGTPSYSVTQSYTINLTYVNLPPVFDPTVNPTIPVNQKFVFTFSSSDPDGDPITLSATGLPTGATFVDNGDGTATFTWTPVAPSSNTLNIVAQDTYNINMHHTTTLVWSINAVNSPIFVSHPVVAANTNGSYKYEVHALDPAGGGLTYSLDTAPNGMQVNTNKTTHITDVTWTPSTMNAGNNSVILRATDVNGNSATQNYTVNVKTTSNNPPQVNSSTPDFNVTDTATEGHNTTITMNATDPDGDALHYAWYWDGTWKDDTNQIYNLLPNNVSAGNHVLHLDITDGAAIVGVDFNFHVRDAQPVVAQSYTFGAGSFKEMAVLPRAGEIVTLRGGATPTVDIFTEAGFQSGPTGSAAGIPFDPSRLIVENDFASPTYLTVYLAQLGAINAGGNAYANLASDTLSPITCTPAFCYPKAFTSGYAAFGGTNEAYLQSSLTTFYINPSNRRYLSSVTNGTANADVDLGAAASASSLILDTLDTPNLLFISVPNLDQVVVLNASTRAVVTTLALPAGSGPTALYFNSVTRNVYTYNTAAGSVTEIYAATQHINATTTGLPKAPSILNDPPPILTGNDADNLLYIANTDNSEIVTFDLNYGTFKVLAGQAVNVVFFDPNTGMVFFGNFNGRTLFNTN